MKIQSLGRCAVAAVALSLAANSLGWGVAAEGNDSKNDNAADRSPEAAQLVRKALEAEAVGAMQERADYLRQALAVDPDCEPAHWQLGEVRVGQAWLAVEAAASENSWSGKFATYRQLRDAAARTASDQMKLARWCQEAGLKDQERLHLAAALQLRPTNSQQRDAAEKLGLVRHRKTLMPAGTAEALKQQAKQAEAALQKWKPLLTRLRGDLESRDKARQQAAAEQLKAIQDVAAIPALETVFAKSTADAGKAAIAALATMPQQAATDSLVRHAVLARHEEVRKAAAEALEPRDVFTYVPLLLSGMNTPIEVSFQVYGYQGGAFGERLSLYREGPLYNTAINTGLTALPNYTPRPGVGLLPTPGAAESDVAGHAAADLLTAAAALEENARTEAINQRIASTLRIATYNDSLGDDAKDCWDWWSEYNETHWSADKPTYETNRCSFTYYSACSVVPGAYKGLPLAPSAPSQPLKWHRDLPGQVACFVPGTKVWTVTGTLEIEKIQAGDWVLAQNVDSGELGYKPVSAVTTGPPLPLVEIHAGGETIRSTLGHLFWVSGSGWRMAKQLKAGELLHTARGPVAIDSVEQQGESACHNLIVPDFNTYFVTDRQVLVHDINIRAPTTSTVPGLVDR